MEVTAVIVARGGSVRLPRKNLKEINGETILARKIRQLKKCKYIDRVVVGSDDLEILNEAKNTGAEAIKRPDNYCDEKVASANQMIGNMCELFTTDVVVWAHCTNPLVDPNTYDAAVIEFIKATKDGYDSLLSVFELKEHLWDSEHRVYNYNPYLERHTLATELSPYFAQDGAIFIQKHVDMKSNSYFFGKKPKLFVMPSEQIMDINTPQDFAIAKAFIEASENLKITA